jgi:integrase
LPWFQHHRLDDITVQEVDRYRAHKLAEGAIGTTTINKSVTLLGQILEQAIDYELIGRNAARGRNRRYRVQRPTRAYLDRAEHIAAVLQAAGELDQAAAGNRRHVGRRAFIAALVFGGLRIEEACGLRWRDVDLANGRMRVGEAKTDAGVRDVDLVPALADELATWKARAPRARPSDFVFATATGRRPSRDNPRDRVFGAATKRAAKALDEAKVDVPLPEGLTPHGMRHTCCSLLFAIGRDPRYVMGFLGHADPAFTLRVYAHEMRRGDGERAALAALVAAGEFPAWKAWAGSPASPTNPH